MKLFDYYLKGFSIFVLGFELGKFLDNSCCRGIWNIRVGGFLILVLVLRGTQCLQFTIHYFASVVKGG